MDALVKELESLRAEDPGERASAWACTVCRTARRVHLYVWLQHPPKDEIRHSLALLRQLSGMMPDRSECAVFRANTLTRVASLESYLTGGLPILPEPAPDEERLMQEHVKLALDWVRHNPPRCGEVLSVPPGLENGA